MHEITYPLTRGESANFKNYFVPPAWTRDEDSYFTMLQGIVFDR